MFKQIDKETSLLRKELKNAVLLLENAKKLLKEGYKHLCSLLQLIEEVLNVLKMPVTQQRTLLPEKLRAL